MVHKCAAGDRGTAHSEFRSNLTVLGAVLDSACTSARMRLWHLKLREHHRTHSPRSGRSMGSSPKIVGAVVVILTFCAVKRLVDRLL